MVLFAVLEIGRTVTVTLSALVALKRFLVTTVAAVTAHWLSCVLQRGVLFQEPRGRETRQAYGAPDQAPAGHLVAGAHARPDQSLLLEHRVQRYGRFCNTQHTHTRRTHDIITRRSSECTMLIRRDFRAPYRYASVNKLNCLFETRLVVSVTNTFFSYPTENWSSPQNCRGIYTRCLSRFARTFFIM